MARTIYAPSTPKLTNVQLAHRGAHQRDKPRSFVSRGFRLERVSVRSPEGFDYGWSGGCHYLSVHDIQLHDGETFSDFAGPSRRRDLRNTLTFVPAGARVWGWSIPRLEDQFFTALYLDPGTVEEELARRVSSADSRGQIYFSNRALKASFDKINYILTSEIRDAMYLESLCLVASLEIGAALSGKVEAQRPAGRLSRATEQKVIEFIDANLAGDIALSDLAAVAGLSRFHFIRVFRRSFNQTPYQFVLGRRVERARALLKGGAIPVEEIAAAVGFNDAARFSRAFRRITGVSPRLHHQ